MFSVSKIAMIISTLAAIAAAGRLPAGLRSALRDSGHEAMPLDDITWTGPIAPGGKNHTFTGTIEKVMAQINQINPDYMARISSTNNETRIQNFDPAITHFICDAAAPGRCPTSYANAGIHYLKNLAGDLNCGLMPGRCGQVSCSHNSGITWCNDSKGRFDIKCKDLWGAASVVVEHCTVEETDLDGFEDEYTWGQAFSLYGFNVIVGQSSC